MARFLPVSLTTLLVELADLDETLALFAALQADPIDGIAEMVPAARTLMIGFRPEKVTPAALAARIATYDLSAKIAPSEHLVEIPVRYDGEDLADVAALTGLAVDEVIRRHTQSEFTVAFCGFAPGFGYLVGGDPALHVPRRKCRRRHLFRAEADHQRARRRHHFLDAVDGGRLKRGEKRQRFIEIGQFDEDRGQADGKKARHAFMPCRRRSE